MKLEVVEVRGWARLESHNVTVTVLWQEECLKAPG